MVASTPSMDSREGVYRTPTLRNRIPEPEPCAPFEAGQSALSPAHVDGRLVCRLAVDIGGTFTDAVLEDGDDGARRRVVKVLTTPRSPAKGLLEASLRALAAGERRPEQVRLILHGTTLATNAILERRGAHAALVTTEGFRDVLDLARGGPHGSHDRCLAKTPPLVPRHLRFEVRQRHGAAGQELQPLDEDGVKAVAGHLHSSGVESVAVCFLHSHVNSAHEERAAIILRTLLPGVHVCTSSWVSPEAREYERFSTAAANAYVQPLMSTYLKDAKVELEKAGFRCPLLLMSSGGGLLDADVAAEVPVRLVESGPAGGVMLAQSVASSLGIPEVLSLDMGGTTTKVCAVRGGRAAVAREFEVHKAEGFQRHTGLPLQIPCLDLVEISGGGGSIASTNAAGAVAVGPRSAGSEPGPACYNRGGREATVTDADVVLGRIDPAAFAAGEVPLQPENARHALELSVAGPQGLPSTEIAAQAVADAVEEEMASAARAHTAEHGRDLESHILVAFGGAAPVRAATLARRLGLRRVLVPPDASVGSAVGFFSAPLAFEAVESRRMLVDGGFDPGAVNAIYRALWHKTVAVVAAGAARWKPGRPAKEHRRAYCRYVGQGKEMAVDLPNRDLTLDDDLMLRSSFEQEYRRHFCHAVPGAAVEVLTWALGLVADSDPLSWPRERLEAARRAREGDALAPPAKRPKSNATRSMFDVTACRFADVPVFERARLDAGSCLEGPAVVSERYTSTVVPAGFECLALDNGFLQLEATDEPRDAGSRPLPLGSTVAGADALRLQLLWMRLLAGAEEQAQQLLRASFSPLVREAGAAACGLFDAAGRLLSLGRTGAPGLAFALAGVVERALVERPSAEQVEDGDALITDDPWVGTGHPYDLTVITPLFWRGELIGFICSAAHTAELSASEQHREQVVHLARQHNLCQDVVTSICARARQPDTVTGDIFALMACNDLGSRRVKEALAEFGASDLAVASEYIRGASQAAMRLGIKRALPEGGEWKLEVRAQSLVAEDVARLEATVQGSGDEVCVNLCAEGADGGVVAAGLAVPFVCAEAHVRFAVACAAGSGVPLNAGSLGVIRVTAEPACALRADRDSVCSAEGRRLLAHLLPDLVLGCLTQATPTEAPLPASSASALCRLDLCDTPQQGEANDTAHIEGGGLGGGPCADGPSAALYPCGLRSIPVEVMEASGRWLVRRRELRRDSGGPGRQRGGLGVRVEIAHAAGEAFQLRPCVGHVHRAPAGRLGGSAGAAASVLLSDGSPLPTSGLVPAGVAVRVDTAGGGGLGPARERCRSAVAADVQRGLVSWAAAVSEYSVPEGELKRLIDERSSVVREGAS